MVEKPCFADKNFPTLFVWLRYLLGAFRMSTLSAVTAHIWLNRTAAKRWRSLYLPLLHTLRVWNARNRQREALRLLAESDYRLRDIGLTRDEALREAAKPFWQR